MNKFAIFWLGLFFFNLSLGVYNLVTHNPVWIVQAVLAAWNMWQMNDAWKKKI